MMKYVLIGDALSPHLLKWAKELSGRVDLWVVSTQDFMPEFDSFLQLERRFSFKEQPSIIGWLKVFSQIPRLAKWLAKIDADWLNPHYLTSHGLLAVLVRRLFKLRASLVGSAWGSDVLLAPQRGWLQRSLLNWVFKNCKLTTSDSKFMAQKMYELEAREVMVFPFGLETMPLVSTKDEFLFFSNRGLEPIYNPFRMLEIFEQVVHFWPQARLVVANSGSLLTLMQSWIDQRGLSPHIELVGRLDAQTQAHFYAKARWFISVPTSDAVSVSIIEAMAHGCLPIVSDLPANRELVVDNVNGRVLPDGQLQIFDFLVQDEKVLEQISNRNRQWVQSHALFAPAIDRFLKRLDEFPF